MDLETGPSLRQIKYIDNTHENQLAVSVVHRDRCGDLGQTIANAFGGVDYAKLAHLRITSTTRSSRLEISEASHTPGIQ